MYTTIMKKSGKETKSPFPAYSSCLRNVYMALALGRTYDVLIFEILQKYAISFDEFIIVANETEKRKRESTEPDWMASLMVKFGIKCFDKKLMADSIKIKYGESKEEKNTYRMRE